MNFFDPTKSIVENLSYLSAPIVAIVGFAAIIQIRLAKKAIVISSRRQAAELGAQQADNYAHIIIPLQNILTDIEAQQKYERIAYPELKEFTIKEIEKKISKKDFDRSLENALTNLDYINPVLNAMDTFSTYFVKGVADDDIAFSSVGLTFCYSVEKYCFDICGARSEEDSVIYRNLVELYNVWNPRLLSEKLSKELDRKFKERKKLKIPKIDILGTK